MGYPMLKKTQAGQFQVFFNKDIILQNPAKCKRGSYTYKIKIKNLKK